MGEINDALMGKRLEAQCLIHLGEEEQGHLLLQATYQQAIQDDYAMVASDILDVMNSLGIPVEEAQAEE